LARRRANTTPITVAVNLTTQQRLWSATKLTPAGVYGHTLLASRTSGGKTHLLGLDAKSGATRWSGGRTLAGAPAIGGAEPGLALVTGTLYGSGRHYLSLLHVASGTHRDIRKPSSQVPIYTCRYDLARTSVCAGPTGQRVLAVDAGSGTVLWRFGGPAHHARPAPSITAALHGAVYASTGNGPVVLDARSGTDRNEHPGIAPVLVNKYVGIGRSPNGVLTIHRATR
jgi:outer membrane protein assembly factor BamB